MDVQHTLEVGTIMIGLIGGLALFLYGMEKMTDALKMVAGGGMKRMLARLTTNRYKGAFAGAFVTAVIQSSSVTTVLLVGFISAGLMTLQQSVGVIMGANIGTTVTAQIIAFKITQYALVMVAIGFSMNFFVQKERIQHYGAMIMGLGLIFFGMELMSGATRPLRTYEPFINLMRQMDNPLTGVLISAAFTALVQSSSATTGVIIVLATQGFITLNAGIALIFGANIGTCITALLSAIGKPTEAKQAALVHIIFNVLGVVLWVGFIDQLASLVRWLSPSSTELSGIAKLAAETPRQIANGHTVFNVVNTCVFIFFTEPLVRIVRWLVPDQEEEVEQTPGQAVYLNEILLQTPELAFDIVRMELGRLGASALRMTRGCLAPIIHGTKEDLKELEQMDNDLDSLHGALVTYLGRLSLENLTQSQSQTLYDYMAAANYLENIGDMIETNLVDTGHARLHSGLEMSDTTESVLTALHEKTCESVEMAIEALVSFDKESARKVQDAKEEINALAEAAEAHLAQRLTADEPNRLAAYRIESEIIEHLKRVYYFAKRIAKVVVEEEMAYIGPTAGHTEERKLYSQAAAIPYRIEGNDLEVLLITTKGKKRWIIPKGKVPEGVSAQEAARNEAFEEAGAKGQIAEHAIDEYQYEKWGGTCVVQVFPLEVEEILDTWPESKDRKRKWVSLEVAAKTVEPDALRRVIGSLQSAVDIKQAIA